MQRIIINIFFMLTAHTLFGQSLRLELPYHAGKEALLVAVHGIREDTISSVILDNKGNGVLVYPAYKKQAGLATVRVKGVAELAYQLVISPNESPVLHCESEYVHSLNATLKGSIENTALNRWFGALSLNKHKAELTQELVKCYKPSDALHGHLTKESQQIEANIKALKDTINSSALFSAKYIRFKTAQEEILAKVGTSKETGNKAKSYFLNEIDFEALYGSSLWFPTINACIEVYMKDGFYYEQFGKDVVANMQKIKDTQVLISLAEAAISVCTQFSWDTDQTAIVDYLIASNRIENPRGKLKKLMQMQAMRVGKKAPDLIITQHIGRVEDHNHQTTILKSEEFSETKTLVIFYQSGCGHCETTMNSLRDNYENITKKGVKIIAISADTDNVVFKNTANSYPWKDSYCDLEGLNGINFKNYAVLGTPTMILMDKTGNIAAKIASTEELLEHIKQDIKF
jgi:alkyl hydroperoxide reductase subunit AhpC